MIDYKSINSNESGLLTRSKLNSMLSALITGEEGVNRLWEKLSDFLIESASYTDESVADLMTYINGMNGGVSGFAEDTSFVPNFPIDKAVTVLGAGAGVYENLLDINGNPIEILEDDAITIFYKAPDVNYWQYKSVYARVVNNSEGGTIETQSITRKEMLSLMDGLSDFSAWYAKAKSVQGSYLVMTDVNISCGVLEMWLDSMSHVLTQKFTTNEILVDGTFNGSHEDFKVNTYIREFILRPTSVGGEFVGLWTDWRLVWCSDDRNTLPQTYKFGGVVSGVTVQTSSTIANSGFVMWDNVNGYFVLLVGLTAYYRCWAAGTATVSSEEWNARLIKGNRFYVDNGDGTMSWFYYDGEQMLETTTATKKDVIEVLTDHEERIENAEDALTTVYNLGEFSSTSAGLTAAAEKSITENRNIRLITFVVPSLKQSVNILQQHFNYITTQLVFLEGKSRTSYQRSITTGDNYVVGDLQQLHLYTTIQVEGNELVGYTADTPDSPNTKRTVICSLDLDSVAALETQAMRTIIEVAGVDYTTTTAPTNSTGTTGLPLYWLARPATFAVKSGTTYYTMPSTDERFAACGLRRVGQLFNCGGETFYLDADLNPVFVNSSVRFDRSGTSVKVHPSNSTLRSLYEAAGAVWNEDTGYYELNGIKDIDEEEMKSIFVKSNNVRLGGNAYHKYAYRTIITPIGSSQSENLISMFAQSSIINVPSPGSNLFAETPALYGFAGNAKNLRIIGNKAFSSVKAFGTAPFSMSRELVHLLIKMLTTNQSIPMHDCVRISYYTLMYLADNWSPTAAVTVTLPTPQATIINTILATGAGVVDDLTVEEQNLIFQQLAQMPWEAKLKIEYTQPIWREDNGSTIAFTNRMPQLDEAGETYTFQDVTYNDVRPSLIKHEKGANGEYIYAAWYGYVNKLLATDRNKVGTELVQYTTALNTNLAVSIYDWIDLANKFGAKNITIADGGAATSVEE